MRNEQYFDNDSSSRFSGAWQSLVEASPSLPFPVRPLVCSCLDSLEGQDPVAAVWFLKDSAEALARLCFVVTAAEVLRLQAERGSG